MIGSIGFGNIPLVLRRRGMQKMSWVNSVLNFIKVKFIRAKMESAGNTFGSFGTC